MVVGVEPGLHIPAVGGDSDTILIREDGCEVLMHGLYEAVVAVAALCLTTPQPGGDPNSQARRITPSLTS